MKQRIAAAYMRMARSGDVDKITVTSLVEACGISRQTFYYHFQDILDVVQWCFQQAVEQTTLRCRQAEGPQAALRLFLDSAAENHPLILRLLSSQHRPAVRRPRWRRRRWPAWRCAAALFRTVPAGPGAAGRTAVPPAVWAAGTLPASSPARVLRPNPKRGPAPSSTDSPEVSFPDTSGFLSIQTGQAGSGTFRLRLLCCVQNNRYGGTVPSAALILSTLRKGGPCGARPRNFGE